MSKLKVDNLESNSKNIKFVPKGTGLVKVKGAGGADGTLQLTAANGSNAVKLKSPAHSAGQSYTMILPDNQVVADSFLKVKSVSGSGATAIGQLEYATIAAPDVSSLNASNITSGTVPSARFPTSFSADSAAFELVQKTTVTASNGVQTISFTNLADNAMYYMVGKILKYVYLSNGSAYSSYFNMNLLDSSGNNYSGVLMEKLMANDSLTHYYYTIETSTNQFINFQSGTTRPKQAFTAEISTIAGYNYVLGKSFHPQYQTNKCLVNGCLNPAYNTTDRIHGIKLACGDSYLGFASGTQILLYKYKES